MAVLIFRFVVFAAIYCAIVAWWADSEGGHGAMGIIAGGILTLGALVFAWIFAIVAGRFVVLPLVRFAIHIVLTFVFFIAGSTAIFLVLDYREAATSKVPFSVTMDFTLTLGAIVALAAFADGLIGLWKNQSVAHGS